VAEAPAFTERSELLQRAYAYAYEAHCGPDSIDDTQIDHPAAVAELLFDAGFDDDVVAAALLHDVVEDTTRGLEDIDGRFGERIGDLVDTMTEDESVADYEERKSEHRRRALASGSAPAAIYAADKLARVRRYLAADDSVPEEKLLHYRRTLVLYSRTRPELPFLDALARELPELEEREAARSADGAR
jgi:GTP pyrophosphokinase